MGQMPNTGIFSMIWLASISGIIYCFLVYKKRAKSVPGEVEELKEKEKQEVIIENYTSAKMEYIQFSDALSYNKTLAQLVFDEKIIQLTGNPLKLFTAFLDSPEHSLDYSFICAHILDRPIRKKTVVNTITNEKQIIQYLDSSDKNVIYQTISALRKN